jgi:hypothetical protein
VLFVQIGKAESNEVPKIPAVVNADAVQRVVAVCAVRFYRLNPILILTATAWLEPSFVFELINNLPLVAQFLMPSSATPVGMSEEALTYLSQLNSLSYLALDFLGFMLAYVGLAIISVVIYRHSRSLAIITAVSFALFLANVPFLWIEPKILASILMGLAILIFAGFPFIMAKVSLQPNDE